MSTKSKSGYLQQYHNSIIIIMQSCGKSIFLYYLKSNHHLLLANALKSKSCLNVSKTNQIYPLHLHQIKYLYSDLQITIKSKIFYWLLLIIMMN